MANWYVPHPLHQYSQDVKALARKEGLRVIDANVVPENERVDEAEKPPKLTTKGKKAAAADAPAAEA